jgi:peptidoglycan-associated lipoprotein
MRLFKLSLWVVLMASLVMGGAGCKRGPKSPTPIHGNTYESGKTGIGTQQPPVDLSGGKPLPEGTRGDDYKLPPGTPIAANPDGSIPLNGDYDRTKYNENREFFKANTVYFDFDRSSVRAAERVRVEEVAAYMKGTPACMVEIEGHCDERGTEEYNRALGERRALAVREYLVNLGIQPERVHTISYGEDKPAEIGNNESAWAKNRRGEFILLMPKQ